MWQYVGVSRTFSPLLRINPVIHLTSGEIRGKIGIVMPKISDFFAVRHQFTHTSKINTEESMENIITFAIPILLMVLLLKILFTPMKWALKLALHAAAGFVCLWLLNSVSGFTGLELPINAVTTLISGIFGVPGIALIALLEIL
jgi:inhibitor of the pro-sigma K processing machinery